MLDAAGIAKGNIMTNNSVSKNNLSAGHFNTPQPGAEPYGAEVIRKFETAAKQRGPDYQPRTRHLRPDGWARYTNRLFSNPVPIFFSTHTIR